MAETYIYMFNEEDGKVVESLVAEGLLPSSVELTGLLESDPPYYRFQVGKRDRDEFATVLLEWGIDITTRK